jgi:hypothetical protein
MPTLRKPSHIFKQACLTNLSFRKKNTHGKNSMIWNNVTRDMEKYHKEMIRKTIYHRHQMTELKPYCVSLNTSLVATHIHNTKNNITSSVL